MSTSTTYPFTTSGNYTASDSDLIEVTGGNGVLSLQTPDTVWFATYTTAVNANWVEGGSGTGTASGATITSNRLDLSGGGAKYVTYDPTSNVDQATQVGAVKFKVTPQYSGNPASSYYYFAASLSDSDNKGKMRLWHDASGVFGLEVLNSVSGSIIASAGMGTFNPSSGTTYEIELNWDFNTGATRLFVDGTQSGVTKTDTGTRGTINHFVIGAEYDNSGDNNNLIEDFVVFNTVQHTANYTAGYTLSEAPYSTSSPSLTTVSTISGRPLTFSSTEVTAGSDTVTYAFRYNSQDYYWDGSAWATSSGPNQANSAASLTETVMRQLDPGANGLAIKVYLNSNDGTTFPSIDTMTLTYDARDAAATEPPLVYFEGYIYTAAAPNPSQAVEIRATEGHGAEEVFISRDWTTIGTTDVNGYFNGYIFPSQTAQDYELRIGTNKYLVTIPNQASVTLSNLTLVRITT